MTNGICQCGKPVKSRDLCSTCYWRKRKSGELKLLPKISVEERFWPRVDKSGECWIWTGNYTRDSHYGVMYFQGRVQPAHRIAWVLAGNEPPTTGYELDHICHVRKCVRPDHLRVVTRKQNNENHQGARRNSRSGFRGVTKVNNRWRAEVRHDGTRYHVGYFDTPEEADAAVQAKRIELHTHNDWDRHIERSTGSHPI